jgi:hypothetical protein
VLLHRFDSNLKRIREDRLFKWGFHCSHVYSGTTPALTLTLNLTLMHITHHMPWVGVVFMSARDEAGIYDTSSHAPRRGGSVLGELPTEIERFYMARST